MFMSGMAGIFDTISLSLFTFPWSGLVYSGSSLTHGWSCIFGRLIVFLFGIGVIWLMIYVRVC